MGNADILQAIRAKIEQRKKSLRAGICNEEIFTRKQRNEMLVATEELSRLMSFLDTLAYNELVELSSSVDNYPKNVCSPSVECERGLRESLEEPTSEELEEEIPKSLNVVADYARRQAEEIIIVIKKYDDYSDEQIEDIRTHLMAMFLEGTAWQKEQMMKKAVPFYKILKVVPPGPERDKVKLIICKED